MTDDLTVGTVLERAHTRRRRKRCPECDGHISIRGVGGEYTWECLECDALGFGYATRSAALEGVQAGRH
ncbi:hypothetical protein ACLI4R_16300 [Natrialbaceae archaeon A-chndr2]